MAAVIDLLPRKEFRTTLENGETITGKFGTWALKRFCTKHNYSLTQLSDALSNNLSIDDMVDFILCAVESSFREAKTQTSFPYNDVDVCKWIDEFGGISSEQMTRLFNHAGEERKKRGGRGLEWEEVQRIFYSANPDPKAFWESTFEEVLLCIQGQVDKWRIERRNSYNLYCMWAGPNPVHITNYAPLPYDDELKQQDSGLTDKEIYDLVRASHLWNN